MAAGVWRDLDAFGTYKGIRAQAQAEFLTLPTEAAGLFLQAGAIAEKYATPDIAAWQYNNAAKALIEYFKTNKVERQALLITAREYLATAEKLDATNQKIKSNIDFCEFWIKAFSLRK